MTGASITVALHTEAVDKALASLAALGRNPQPMMAAIGAGLWRGVQERFVAARDPAGNPWKPLLPAYAAIKQGPGILRGRSNVSGGLQGSIIWKADARTVTIGSNKVYAAIHQFGGVIRPKKPGGRLAFHLFGGLVLARSVTIPARPYLGLSDADRATVADAAHDYLEAALAGRRTG